MHCTDSAHLHHHVQVFFVTQAASTQVGSHQLAYLPSTACGSGMHHSRVQIQVESAGERSTPATRTAHSLPLSFCVVGNIPSRITCGKETLPKAGSYKAGGVDAMRKLDSDEIQGYLAVPNYGSLRGSPFIRASSSWLTSFFHWLSVLMTDRNDQPVFAWRGACSTFHFVADPSDFLPLVA